MSYKIVTKYIKNIEFNIPDAKSYFLIEKNIKDYKINFDIKSKRIKEDIIEIDTNFKLRSQIESNNQIKVSILFSCLINLENKITDKRVLEKIVLVDVPTSIYPDIRSIIVFLFEKCGFKNINIDQSINFEALHKKNS
tara:strand:+ start:10170 stop:10583 length:414 start_codon:yes stop_codon:yes gene_type:complete